MITRILNRIEYFVLIGYLFLLRLPVALGFRQNPTIRLVFIIPLLAITVYRLFVTLAKGKLHLNKPIFILFGLYGFFLSFAYFRTGLSGAMPVSTVVGNFLIWLTIALFGINFFGKKTDEKTRYQHRRGIFLAFGFYVLLNFGLYLIGYQSPETLYTGNFKASLLATLGISANRVVFPTAGGINSFGTTVGVFLVASFATLSFKSSPKFDKGLAAIGGISSMCIILLTDSRGALAFSFLTIFLMFILPKKLLPTIKWLPFLTPLIPIGLFIFLNLLPGSITKLFSRSQNDFANMSNRLVIWNTILEDFGEPQLVHLWGYGYRGQVVSKVSSQYASLFTSYVSEEVASAHNFLLQSILEVGYIGTGFFLVLLSALLLRLALLARHSKYDYTPRLLLFMLVYYILMGTTEATLSSDFQEAFTMFLLILFATAATTEPYGIQPVPSQTFVPPAIEVTN